MQWWKNRKDRAKMGRLAPGGGGYEKTRKLPPLSRRHPCDRCGVSDIDGGRIADASYEIKTPNGSIFLCTHHFNKNRIYALERGYEVSLHESCAR